MGIYLDNAATSYPKPKEVIEAMCDFMTNNGCSSGRGAYENAMTSDMLVYEGRKYIGELFNFNDPKRVIFTSNITESLNMIMRGLLKEGDHVITSSIEHNAVWRCLKLLQREINIDISKVSCDEYGYTNSEDVKKCIQSNTALIVFTHASNVLGTIQPIREIGQIARDNNIPFVVDSAQTAGMYPIDVKNDNIDILAFTGHKSLFGPMGVGGFIINCDYNINPIKAGGTGGDSAYEYQPDYYPNKLEVGTLNVPGIIGLKEGIKFIKKIGVENIHLKEKELLEYAINKLSQIKQLMIYGCKKSDDITPVITFNVKNRNPEEIGYLLDQKYNIMVRVGLHCAPSAHRLIDTIKGGAIRIGIGYFNEKEDIDALYNALLEIVI